MAEIITGRAAFAAGDEVVSGMHVSQDGRQPAEVVKAAGIERESRNEYSLHAEKVHTQEELARADELLDGVDLELA